MSELTVLQATLRSDMGKGASRRLRRANGVPAIIYGSKKASKCIRLQHNKVIKALENESFYASVFAVEIEGNQEKVILKDLQRHVYKNEILHMDLQRVSATDKITKVVPLHFLNEETAKGVKLGGQVAHTMTEIEITCQAQNLPSYIEVDVKNVGLDEALHLSELKLAKGIELTVDISDKAHDHPVVSINTIKQTEEETEEHNQEDTTVTDEKPTDKEGKEEGGSSQ